MRAGLDRRERPGDEVSPAGGGGHRHGHRPEVPAAHWALKVGAARAQRDTAGGVGFRLCRETAGHPPTAAGAPPGAGCEEASTSRASEDRAGRESVHAPGVLTPPSAATVIRPLGRQGASRDSKRPSTPGFSEERVPPGDAATHAAGPLRAPKGLPRGPRGPARLSPRPWSPRQQHAAAGRSIL